MNDDFTSTARVPVQTKGARAGVPCLVLIAGPPELVGRQFPLVRKSMTIGRYSTCDIHVTESSLSKIHARVALAGDQVTIADLDTTNGTAVNAKLLSPSEAYQLRDGDQIRMGSVIFKFLEEGKKA